MPKLIERLEAQRQIRAGIADVHAAYVATLAELRRTPFLESALQPGAPFPDFLLPNAEERLVSRDDLLAHGPVVATFFRGTWCPYCAIQLAALQEVLPEIAAAGASLAAFTPETGGR